MYDMDTIITQPDPPAFLRGDMITFEKQNGSVWILVILNPSLVPDAWECMWWNGRPQRITLAQSVLDGLRVIKRDRCSEENMAHWEAMLECAA